jgi:hypothetical protein
MLFRKRKWYAVLLANSIIGVIIGNISQNNRQLCNFV